MTIKARLQQLKEMILGEAEMQGAFRREAMSNLRTGGYAGYKPSQQEPRRRRARPQQQEQPAPEYASQEPWGQQQMAYQQPDPYQQAYTGPQQGFGMSQGNYVPQSYGYVQPEQMQPQPGYGYYQPYQQGPADNGYVESPAAQPAPDNVIMMPGVQRDEQGQTWRHREIVAQPVSTATCYRLIEFMRQGMTVIVNTELINDQREVQRCLDLLFGAAFTMNCGFHRIAARSLYMITPADVQVDAYENLRQGSNEDVRERWNGAREMLYPERQRKAAAGGYRSRESFSADSMYAAHER
ncbi:MAG: cell division protein SepF [Clostridia bacterium]|nr:cell division protein SepF [Clostridia bacterium]